jgi:hypothetical protein
MHINITYARIALAPDVQVFRMSSKLNYGTSLLIAYHFIRNVCEVSDHTHRPT